ncbi:MAG TPA: glutamine--fructose-6-phosphate transaminase (isomerizing) [Gammaproteobacteria bacterium]|nr:glutamine--fructose-6-phosphate transaminase (isomerizing) [Gammaproteobacteria bacterium]
MCGIVGAVSERNIEQILINGLKRLEYRGYDSAGLAVIDTDKKLQRLRAQGKVRELESALLSSDLRGPTGIAHTRWATHGAPSEHNAHPLTSHDQFALVHNGIIENHDVLRKKLLEKGYSFTSETDSETIVHLLHFYYQDTQDFLKAVQKTVAELEGAYALGITSSLYPGQLIAVRHGAPLVIGHGIVENFFASDPLALSPITKQFTYLEDGDVVKMTAHRIDIFDANHQSVERKLHNLDLSFDVTDRGEHRHFMSKEIFEQPHAIASSLEGRITKDAVLDTAFGMQAKELLKQVEHVQIVACGTSYHAGMVARYWIEALAGVPCSVEVASEYRYRKMVVPKNSLFVTLSQSGETADTLAALRLAKKMGFLSSLAICNVPESSLVRESNLHFMTRAGAEIGVASTKAFTTQLTALLLFTIALGRHHHLSPEIEKRIAHELPKLANAVKTTLKINEMIAHLAHKFIDKNHALFLGRGVLYPIALEGALKLKEISYIHAEGYPAGELKHGPLALVDKNMPVIALAPGNELIEKIKSNLHEVRARGGELFVFTDSLIDMEKSEDRIHIIEMPSIDPVLTPIIYTIPMQLLAYHVAVLKGTDVDQPRNLAKSVTVE